MTGLRSVLGSMLGITFVLVSAHAMSESVAIKVAPVQFTNHAQSVVATGVIRPVSEQTLSFKTPGIVKTVTVEQGQQVKKGQLLAVLELEEVNAQVDKAQAVLTDAQRQLERLIALEGNRLTSDEQIRQVKTAVEVARSDLRSARFNQRYAHIYAPSDGRVLTRHVERNELVASGAPVFMFADEADGWSVHLAVADVDVVMLNTGDVATITLDAYPGDTFNGVVHHISGRAHGRSQTFALELKLDTPRRLYSGLIAHVKMTPSVQRNVAKIPMSALIKAQGNQASVYVINAQGHAQLQDIQLAYIDADFSYVKSGINQGDNLVIQGGPFINNGKDIVIVDQ